MDFLEIHTSFLEQQTRSAYNIFHSSVEIGNGYPIIPIPYENT